MHFKLDESALEQGCLSLAGSDPDLGLIFTTYGVPPLWARETGFATLVRIILEQQVSLASAGAAFDKLSAALPEPEPAGFLTLSDIELRKIGFSRQKTAYSRILAESILNKSLDLGALESLTDAEAKHNLMKIKGIGGWTADIYLLMALLRPDIMPKGDLALHVAYQKLKQLQDRPLADEFQEISAQWQPFRSVAARLLWHFYLSS